MSQALVNLIYNPGSLNTAEAVGEREPEGCEAGKNGDEIIGAIEELSRGELDVQAAYRKMIAVKRCLMLPVALGLRFELVRSFNRLLGRLAGDYTNAVELFQAAIQTLVLIKEQMDGHPQRFSETSRAEWVEMEKAVYGLSLWEEKLSAFWAEAN